MADLNLDGLADLVAASSHSHEVSVFLNRVDGTYEAKPRIRVGQQPAGVALADFDSNGFPDVVTANTQSGDVSVLLGTGDGTFLPPRSFAAGSGPYAVATGDLDRDVGVVAAEPQRDQVAGQERAVSGAQKGDGNGTMDLVAAARGRTYVSLLKGRGDTFLSEVRLTVGSRPASAALADLNGDGALDLVTSNIGSYDLSMRLGQGNGNFLATQSYPLVIANQPGSVAVGDVTGDGKLDLVATGVDDMWVLEGRGDGTFGPSQRFAGGGDSLVLEDLDGNGTLDAVSIRGDVQVLPHL